MDFKNCFAPKSTYLLTLIFHKLVEVSLYTVSTGCTGRDGKKYQVPIRNRPVLHHRSIFIA